VSKVTTSSKTTQTATGRVVSSTVGTTAAPARNTPITTSQENTMSKSANTNTSSNPFMMMSAEEISQLTKQNSEALMRSAQTLSSGMTQMTQTLSQFSQNMLQMSLAAFCLLYTSPSPRDH
jgi:hypothetical protein